MERLALRTLLSSLRAYGAGGSGGEGSLTLRGKGGGNIDLERAMGHIGAVWTRILVVA